MTTMNFAELQRLDNLKMNRVNTPALQAAMAELSDKLKLLRGDNLYDVIRLYFSTKGLNSEQFELKVDIGHGESKEESALKVTRVVTEDILAPVGLRMIRSVMGRVIVDDNGIVGAFVHPEDTATKATYDVLGLPVFCEWFRDQFNKHLHTNPTNYLTRVCKDGNGGLTTVVETVRSSRKVPDITKFYPYFNRTPKDTWEAFNVSSSNVLMVYGVWGSGKSSYLMEMINARGWDDRIYLADRDDVLNHPGFPDFIRDLPEGSIVITEDSDKMVMKRTEGNGTMSALLNATAGIVSRNIKLIISTNLSSTRDVDPALLRFGRCFDILKFKTIDVEQANDIRNMMELEPFEFKAGRTDITLAEAINAHEIATGRDAGTMGYR